jgi:hypothetical protein
MDMVYPFVVVALKNTEVDSGMERCILFDDSLPVEPVFVVETWLVLWGVIQNPLVFHLPLVHRQLKPYSRFEYTLD